MGTVEIKPWGRAELATLLDEYQRQPDKITGDVTWWRMVLGNAVENGSPPASAGDFQRFCAVTEALAMWCAGRIDAGPLGEAGELAMSLCAANDDPPDAGTIRATHSRALWTTRQILNLAESTSTAKLVKPKRKQRWTPTDAEPFVRAWLIRMDKDGGDISLRKAEADLSIPKTTIGRTKAWTVLGSDKRRHVAVHTDLAADNATASDGPDPLGTD